VGWTHSIPGRAKDILFLLPGPDQFWSLPSLPSGVYRGHNSRGAKPIAHLHLVPKLIMCGTIPPLPHVSSWCGA